MLEIHGHQTSSCQLFDRSFSVSYRWTCCSGASSLSPFANFACPWDRPWSPTLAGWVGSAECSAFHPTCYVSRLFSDPGNQQPALKLLSAGVAMTSSSSTDAFSKLNTKLTGKIKSSLIFSSGQAKPRIPTKGKTETTTAYLHSWKDNDHTHHSQPTLLNKPRGFPLYTQMSQVKLRVKERKAWAGGGSTWK